MDKIEWLEEGYILRIRFSGSVGPNEFRQAVTDCLSKMETQHIHFLIDLSAATAVDPQIIALPLFSHWINHPNSGWHVYVQPPRLLDRLMAIRIAGSYRSFATEADALNFLNSTCVEQ
jgi:hypothetical protein